MDLAEKNETVVCRFYGELWNGWRLDVVDEIMSSELRFRRSLGSTHEGRDEFKRYVERMRTAFPTGTSRSTRCLLLTIESWRA